MYRSEQHNGSMPEQVTVRYAGVGDSDGAGPEADAVIEHYDELPAVMGVAAAGERLAA